MQSIVTLLNEIIGIYIWVLIASAVLSICIAFNLVNMRNQFVYTLGDILNKVTEPALRPIRQILPAVRGIDFSPLILILLLYFLRDLMCRYLGPCGWAF